MASSGGIRVLGPVEVVGAGGPVALTSKQRCLLAALVVADGRSCDVDELIDALWGESPPSSASKLVQVYVSQLRKLLPDNVGIRTSAGAYALEVPKELIDAARFGRLVAESASAREDGNHALAASLAGQGLDLWRGRAFGELAYADFARGHAERLEGLRLAALAERLAADLALGRHAEILGEVVALAREHSLDERLQELAMLALYRCGRQSEALDHYAAVRRHLRDELGLEPGSALRELQQQILNQDPALDAPPGAHSFAGSTLNVPATPLVGRGSELGALGALLHGRESRLLVLTGAGGSGKTRLAIEAAGRAAGSFANGVTIVELAPLRDAALVAPTVAQALDVAEIPGEDLEDTLARALGPRELLLIVDNAEHLREAAPLFAHLVARAPRLMVLVTSRAVLHVSGEHVFPVEPLAEDDALDLLVQRTRQLAPTFAPTDENDAELREICRRLDGLPLAIELAAARLRTLTPRLLLERLGARLALLTSGPRDLPARQQTLRETIDWSVGLLSDTERHVLARLAVFPAGATLEAAEAVCGADLDSLGVLVDHHLVLRAVAGNDPRFSMLETVREYALELLDEERPRVELALAEHFALYGDELRLSTLDWWRAVERIDLEVDNVRVALAAAEAAGDAELRVRLVGGFWQYWYTRGPVGQALEWIEQALAAGAGNSTAARASALRGGSALAWLRGEPERARKLARSAIAVAVEAGSTFDELGANNLLGFVALGEGDYATARHHHRRALELKEELGIEPVAEKLNLGVVALDSKEHDEAIALFEDVLESHRRNENLRGIVFALANLGLAHYELGDHERSRRDFEEARACAERTGQREQLAYALQGLAAGEAHGNRFEEAARLLGRARHELDELGTPEDRFSREMLAATTAQARDALGEAAYEAAYAEGRT